MSVIKLIDQRNAKLAEMDIIISLGQTEKRKLDETETGNVGKLDSEITDLNAKILEARNLQATPKDINLNKNKPVEKRTSLIGEINKRMAGNVSEPISLSTETKEEMEYRALIQATGAAGTGIEIVATEKLNILEPLREALVLVQAGATYLTGLKGDISIPSVGGTSAAWKGENITAVDGAGAFAQVDLKPKRITAFIDISKQFLAQDGVGAENMLLADIARAIAIKLEGTIFGKAAGSATQPAGFFVAAPAINGVATYANMVALETAVDTANALMGNLKYITNAGGRGILKTVPKVANFPEYLLDKGEMNGYPVLATNNVAKELQAGANEFGVVFGNWNDFVVAQWGSVELTLDTLTQALLGNVRVVVNAYFDAAPRRAVSFATASIVAGPLV
jgi:HK97 family phage major capsid protein